MAWVEGEGTDAITARIEAHLNAGDIGAAIAEWEKLPETPKPHQPISPTP
ncbi:hypothetical protein [Phyllobacterium zundukense]|nr:hypothetical protein [Phyllobacterium zundukense]